MQVPVRQAVGGVEIPPSNRETAADRQNHAARKPRGNGLRREALRLQGLQKALLGRDNSTTLAPER
eukprot:8084358-Pyramimonas_sp.AAC.1